MYSDCFESSPARRAGVLACDAASEDAEGVRGRCVSAAPRGIKEHMVSWNLWRRVAAWRVVVSVCLRCGRACFLRVAWHLDPHSPAAEGWAPIRAGISRSTNLGTLGLSEKCGENRSCLQSKQHSPTSRTTKMFALLFDLEDYATTYRATRDAYLKAANELKLATGPYKAARDAYVAATATYTKSLYE